jgi:alternate signal-mediated exported protein
MNKSTKGAIAAGAAAVLLLGGAGSLAYWTSQATVAGGSFSTGNVSLTGSDCSTVPWAYTTTGHVGDPTTVGKLVPGDTIAKDCTITLTGQGDHLWVSLTAPSSVTVTPTPSSTSLQATVATTYTYNGASVAAGTPFQVVAGANPVTVHYAVTFPYGDATTIDTDDTQSLSVALGDLNVTLTQEDPNSTPAA